ncbi:MAG: hypothetical protein KF861_22660, partial [Planctomycetaceae bacterium]|nr:hypothetical protein [Planctomycetaceae bacterium]
MDVAPATEPNDDLPEWEPLTPELVEEEAIRGDFMLRWAAILLAVLFGWTQVDRTEALVHVRSGQSLLHHGILPPSNDVFSASASDRRWVNLSWLWDLLVGGIEHIVGPAGLSLLSAVIAFFTFWTLVQTSVPGVSTWWGSVCAALAALACFPSLTAVPHIVTLLGTALTLRLLYRWQGDASQSLWPLVAVFVLWANLDSRAWIGGVIVVLFALGTWLDQLRGRRQGESHGGFVLLTGVALACLAVMLVHPFGWETWRSPVRLYSTEYPGLRAYVTSDLPYVVERYSAALPEFWKHLDLYTGASLLLMLIAAITLMLNRKQLRLSSVLVILGVNVIGIAGGRELAVASIANAILATINAQQWYRVTFRQSYSVEPAELLFSRGGRALTVMILFGVAFATVGGHLMGADGRRVGMGLDPELIQQIASYQELLAEAYDDRAFNFRLEQGDLLIWVGKKPFIDSRIGLYGGSDSLIDEHLAVRNALRKSGRPTSAIEENDVSWAESFDRYQIQQVLPRLSGAEPDYLTMLALLSSPEWRLTGLEGATASFYRTNSGDGRLNEYIRQHDATDFVTRYVRENQTTTPENSVPRGTWPRPPTFYEEYVYRPERASSNGIRLARHYEFLRRVALENQRLGDAIALAYASIRSARDGLRDSPYDPDGYRHLSIAYGFLGAVEQSIQQNQGMPHLLSGRYHQIMAAAHQELDCSPADADSQDRVDALYRLFEV